MFVAAINEFMSIQGMILLFTWKMILEYVVIPAVCKDAQEVYSECPPMLFQALIEGKQKI